MTKKNHPHDISIEGTEVKPTSVPFLFPDETAVLLATGPSLSEEQIELIKEHRSKIRVFGCNDSFRIYSDLDVMYACDGPWWRLNAIQALKSLSPNTHVWTQDVMSAQQYGITLIAGDHSPGLYTSSRDKIHFGGNSGYQLLNLAYHYGIRKFLLCGYDMKHDNGKTHFFGNHDGGLNNNSPYPVFLKSYNTIQPSIANLIINCSPGSALKKFKHGDLKTELEAL